MGIVESVISVNIFVVVHYGAITNLTGLADGVVYFLDASNAGAFTSIEPTSIGQISKPILVATSTTTGIVLNMRGIEIASSYGTMSNQDANNVAITGGTISGVDIELDNAYVSDTITHNGYVTIKDSTGAVYKLMVGS